jgi:hypothetical protein
MNTGEKNIHDLYEGLVALTDDLFPKKCMNCGRIYKTEEDYIKQTRPTFQGTGLASSVWKGDNKSIVQLYRNCVCGSTLLSFFGDRRDSAKQGKDYRRMFEELLQLLEEKGADRKTARGELLKVMRGETSNELTRFGIGPGAPAQTSP